MRHAGLRRLGRARARARARAELSTTRRLWGLPPVLAGTVAQAIRRRQQFYGEVYYHTTRDNADVQPLDSNDDTLGLGEFDWLKERFESALWRSKVFGDTPFPTQILVNE